MVNISICFLHLFCLIFFILLFWSELRFFSFFSEVKTTWLILSHGRNCCKSINFWYYLYLIGLWCKHNIFCTEVQVGTSIWTAVYIRRRQYWWFEWNHCRVNRKSEIQRVDVTFLVLQILKALITCRNWYSCICSLVLALIQYSCLLVKNSL